MGLEGRHAFPMPGVVILVTDWPGWSVFVGLWVGYAFLTSVIIVELLNVVAPPRAPRGSATGS